MPASALLSTAGLEQTLGRVLPGTAMWVAGSNSLPTAELPWGTQFSISVAAERTAKLGRGCGGAEHGHEKERGRGRAEGLGELHRSERPF